MTPWFNFKVQNDGFSIKRIAVKTRPAYANTVEKLDRLFDNPKNQSLPSAYESKSLRSA